MCGVEYADFVVCTFPEDNKPVIHVERIMADIEFWSQCVKKSTEFFTVCILPELLGRWYTRPCISSKGSTHPPGPSSESILNAPAYQNHKQIVLQRNNVIVKILKMMETR